MSPPVLRSMSASAPYLTAMRAFSSSGPRSGRSREVPTLAFTFTASPSPMAQGSGECKGLKGTTARPVATMRRTHSGSAPSALAALTISSEAPPLAWNMMLIAATNPFS